MDSFIQELPALIITLAVLAMATVLIIIARVNVSDALAIVSPAVAFWFLRGAFNSTPASAPGSPTEAPQSVRVPTPPSPGPSQS